MKIFHFYFIFIFFSSSPLVTVIKKIKIYIVYTYLYIHICKFFSLLRFWYIRIAGQRIGEIRIRRILFDHLDDLRFPIAVGCFGIRGIEYRGATFRRGICILHRSLFAPSPLRRTNTGIYLFLGIRYTFKTGRSSRCYINVRRIRRGTVRLLPRRYADGFNGPIEKINRHAGPRSNHLY